MSNKIKIKLGLGTDHSQKCSVGDYQNNYDLESNLQLYIRSNEFINSSLGALFMFQIKLFSYISNTY